MRKNGDRNVRGGDRRLSDRGFGVNREGDRGGSLPAGSGFSPITRTYDTEGAALETIPAGGAVQVVIEVWAGGGGGSRSNFSPDIVGGGSSGYGKKTIALQGSDAGKTINYTVGTHGSGRTGSIGNGTNGTNSTVSSGTFTLSTITVNAGGGGQNTLTGPGGAAGSGGDTNTAGNTAVTSTGRGAPNGGANAVPDSVGSTPGGGGSGGSAINVNGSNGAAGRVRFTYT